MPTPYGLGPYALVVEDDREVAHIFEQALRDAGYQTEVVATGQKAQARLAFINPDLIVVDMHLPQVSGDVVLRQLRGQRRLHRAHVVVATGDAQVAQDYGQFADQVLVKPVGYEQVRKLAESLIAVSA